MCLGFCLFPYVIIIAVLAPVCAYRRVARNRQKILYWAIALPVFTLAIALVFDLASKRLGWRDSVNAAADWALLIIYLLLSIGIVIWAECDRSERYGRGFPLETKNPSSKDGPNRRP